MTQELMRFRPIDTNAYLQARSMVSVHQARFPEPALKVLTQEVLSRLANRLAYVPLPSDLVPDSQIEAFCDALLADNTDEAHDLIDQHRRDGASIETVYLGYIARGARRLGERWDRDLVSFVQVSIAAGRMFAIMRGLRPVIETEPPPNSERHALFASVPGETHTLGVSIAADMFRERGWRIDLEVGRNHDELIQALEQSDHQIIGLSASRPENIVDMARLVIALRITKPHCLILASGPITDDVPDLEAVTGVDIVATDVQVAIAELEHVARHARFSD